MTRACSHSRETPLGTPRAEAEGVVWGFVVRPERPHGVGVLGAGSAPSWTKNA
jgi:hypothetical protein